MVPVRLNAVVAECCKSGRSNSIVPRLLKCYQLLRKEIRRHGRVARRYHLVDKLIGPHSRGPPQRRSGHSSQEGKSDLPSDVRHHLGSRLASRRVAVPSSLPGPSTRNGKQQSQTAVPSSRC